MIQPCIVQDRAGLPRDVDLSFLW